MQVGVPSADGKFTLEPQKRPILIHDLFRHTSGLTYGGRPDGGSPISAQWPSGSAASYMGKSSDMAEALTKLPLVYQPGTVFEYSLSFDVLGAVVEKVTGKTLGGHLADTVWKPLKMTDTTFRPTDAQRARIARPFPNNPLDGKPQNIGAIDKPPTFDCGGACAFGTMGDYIRFGQMLLNGGSLDGQQVLSPAFVQLMTTNHLGAGIQNRVANVEPHRDGYGFGLGVAVRLQPGLAAVPGNPGEFSWNGANGTGFFADPKQQLVVAFGTAAPGELRKYYRGADAGSGLRSAHEAAALTQPRPHEDRQVVHPRRVPRLDAAQALCAAGARDRAGRPVPGRRAQVDRDAVGGRRAARHRGVVHRRLQERADLQPHGRGAAGLDNDREPQPLLGADRA